MNLMRKIDGFMSDSKPIGELNGGWAILLKISLVCFPIFVTLSSAWCGWASVAIVQNSYFREQATVLQADNRDQIRAINARIGAMPEWRERVLSLEADQKRIVEQTARILVEIEYLKSAIKQK